MSFRFTIYQSNYWFMHCYLPSWILSRPCYTKHLYLSRLQLLLWHMHYSNYLWYLFCFKQPSLNFWSMSTCFWILRQLHHQCCSLCKSMCYLYFCFCLCSLCDWLLSLGNKLCAMLQLDSQLHTLWYHWNNLQWLPSRVHLQHSYKRLRLGSLYRHQLYILSCFDFSVCELHHRIQPNK